MSNSVNEPSRIVLETPLQDLKNLYQNLAMIPLQKNSPISAFQISFEFTVYLRRVFAENHGKIGLGCKSLILNLLKDNLCYCLALSEMRLDDEGNQSSAARIWEFKKWRDVDWMDKGKKGNFLAFDYDLAYVDGEKNEYEEGRTVNKSLLEKWIVQIDGLLLLINLEKTGQFHEEIFESDELHSTIIQAYVSLEKIEQAVDYARYFPSCSKYLCHNLMTIWSQVDDKLMLSNNDMKSRAYYEQIWKYLWTMMTDLDGQKNNNKLDSLNTLLCIHIEADSTEFRISDEFNLLLLEHCSLEYAKKLAEFDFVSVSF